MASAVLSRPLEKVVGYPPLSEMSALQRREFHEALLDADSFEDLPGKWQRRSSKQTRTGWTYRSSTAAGQERTGASGLVGCCLRSPRS
jgi:hypothetical protein